MQTEKIKILHIEDLETDVELVDRVLSRAGINFDLHVVDSRENYIASLKSFLPDIIISDHSLPSFNSTEALNILQEFGMRIPFILLTGRMSDEFAAEIILKGADDYILKDRINRLPNAITNALDKFRLAKEQQLLVDKQTLAASIVNFSNEAIVSKMLDGTINSWNKGAQRIFGYSEQEAIGKNISFLIPLELIDEDREFVRQVSTGLAVINYETKRKTKSGDYCSVLLTSSPLRDAEGNITGIATILNDITELKTSYEINSKARYQLEATLNQSMDVICTADAEGRFVTMNAASERIWGYTPDEMINRPFMDFVCEEYKENTLNIALKIMEGVEQTNFENCFEHKDHRHVPVIWSSRWDKQSNLMYAVARDGRERKEADLERSKMIKDILQRNKDLEQFSFIISHNLRTPVANISGAIDLLQTPGLEKDFEKIMLRSLDTEVKKLDGVIHDLNTILQIKHSENKVKELVIFSEVVAEVEHSIKQLTETTDFKIVHDFSAVDEMLSIKSYIYSIFLNLISNSIKYRQHETKPIIEVTSSWLRGNIQMTFKDNGVGIDLAVHGASVFSLYKRFHNHVEGKGMGLYMVKTQVESLGGTIDINSEVNKGTEFSIIF